MPSGRPVADSGGGGDGPPDPPPHPPKTKTPTGGSPGLLTSTGGLYGFNYVLVLPILNTKHNIGQFFTLDIEDFNCEEDVEYIFKQEEMQHLRQISVHRILVTYRDLGKVKVIFSVTTYSTESDKYTTKESKIVTLGSAKADKKLHGKKIDIAITGERPQLRLFRKAKDGPLAITKISMVGTAPEEQQL